MNITIFPKSLSSVQFVSESVSGLRLLVLITAIVATAPAGVISALGPTFPIPVPPSISPPPSMVPPVAPRSFLFEVIMDTPNQGDLIQ